jgi:hypothetical protein
MAKFAVLNGSIVFNIIEAKTKKIAEEATGLTCIQYTDENPVSIGWNYVDGVFVAPVVVDETIPQ